MVIKNLISMAAIVAFSACSTAPTNTESDAIINNIMTRTSIRQYTSQQVEAEKVETILKAAMAAPTAVNKQPWAFVVIDQRSRTRYISIAYSLASYAFASSTCHSSLWRYG